MYTNQEIDLESCGVGQGVSQSPSLFKRRSSTQRTASKQMTPVEVKLLELLFGHEYSAFDKEARFFLDYIQLKISTASFKNTLDRHLLPTFHPHQSHNEQMLWLICVVLEIYRGSDDPAIQRVLNLLGTQHEVLHDTATAHDDPTLKLMIFSIVGWVSSLFEPTQKIGRVQRTFSIENPSPASNLRTSVPMDKSVRPLDELLRAFGDILPKRNNTEDEDDTGEVTFQVSHMNAATLRSIGKISITWVDSLSAHLSFDSVGRSLCLFRLPSVCKLQQSEISILNRLAQNLYIDGEQPGPDFSILNLLVEIQLSYALIFHDRSSSRALYRTSERMKAAFDATHMTYKVDPVLDELCGLHESNARSNLTPPARDSYDATTDFPIFKDRLKKVQLFMQAIQPTKIGSLWEDRRDLRLWYTIWIVVFLGAISIIQQFVSIGLAAAQLRLAEEAYELQKKQEL